VPTFEQALEQTYIETWTLRDRMETLREADPRTDHRTVSWRATEAVNVYQGAMRVLAVLLQMDSQIGVRHPATASGALTPDPDQAHIRLLQWAVASGRMTRNEYQRIVVTHPSKGLAAAHMGKDFEPIDRAALPPGRAEPGFWPVGYRPV
jgi:hypothetical protein